MKILDTYKKLTLANFLNWFAVRLLRVTKIFCGRLISYAIILNPHREIFKKNLIDLQCSKFLPLTKKLTIPFYSVSEGCILLSQKIEYFDRNQTIQLSLPQIANSNFKVNENHTCTAKLPDTYLAELKNATVLSGTDLVIVQDTALYDEIDKEKIGIYSIKSKIIDKISLNNVTLNIPRGKYINIQQGIHFTKDHSVNYYHWLIECLPRLSLIEHLEQNIPLLIDANIPHQSLEALELINNNRRKLITLCDNTYYKVKQLYYPSQLSILHDNYNNPDYSKDAVYSKVGINFVRSKVLNACGIESNKEGFRKIYISRKTSDYRQLLNANEIENLLIALGFEIIFPEKISFFAQVRLFSQAKIIVGQGGAGMANMIFAPKTCKLLILISDVQQTNLHLFHSIAESIGVTLEFMTGRHVSIENQYIRKYSIHADFFIDPKLLLQMLDI